MRHSSGRGQWAFNCDGGQCGDCSDCSSDDEAVTDNNDKSEQLNEPASDPGSADDEAVTDNDDKSEQLNEPASDADLFEESTQPQASSEMALKLSEEQEEEGAETAEGYYLAGNYPEKLPG